MIKKLLYIFVLSLFSVSLTAQEKEISAAENFFAQRNYTAAIKYYKKALRKTDSFNKQRQMAYKIALSYYKMGNYKNAEAWFADVINDKTDSIMAYLYYADILSVDKRYDDAIAILQKALKISPDNKEIKNKIEANRTIIKLEYLDTLNLVTKVKELNSGYSDYSLGWWNGKLVFASTRGIQYGNSLDGRTGEGFSKLYYSEKDNETGKWSRVVPMPSKLGTPYNDGAFAFDSVHNIAYWTSCNEKSRRCLIYKSSYNKYKKQWQRPSKVSFMIEGFNYGHVAVAPGGNTLYFVSNMTGGYGGNDIWKISKKDDGNWGIPVNLGEEVNSEKDEMFPSLVGDSLLFFSSEGHNGLGGLDMFFSIKTNLGFSKPVHLDYPLNSAADDFGLLVNKNGTQTYFCSNRDLDSGDDIYTFKGFPLKIVVEGKVVHSLDKEPVANVSVIFKNSKNITDTVFTGKEGKYSYVLNIFDNYIITASKKGYYDESRTLGTNDKELLKLPAPQKVVNFELTKRLYPCGIRGVITYREEGKPAPGIKVYIRSKDGFSTYVTTDTNGVYLFEGLKPNTIYTVKTGEEGYFSESRVCILPKVNRSKIFGKENGYDMDFELTKIRKDKEIVLNNIYYDFDRATLREASKKELDKLASMLNETPNVVVQISSHTDTRGKADYNLKLSAERAKSVVDYLVSKGVDRSRLIAKGYGESRPVIANAQTEQEHQANRRTTFKVIDINHKGKIVADTETGKPLKQAETLQGLVYHIQLVTTSKKLNIDKDFEKLKKRLPELKIFVVPYGKLYKYEAGETVSLSDAEVLKNIIKNSGYKDCFIVPYYKNRKISVKEAEMLEKGGSL